MLNETNHNKPTRRVALVGVAALAALGTACGDDDVTVGSGSLTVILESEDPITDGLTPGEGGEDIRDGWAATFDKYLGVIGDIDVHLATNEAIEAEAEDVFVVDLVQVPPTGLALWTLADLQEGRWEFNYSTPGAADGAMRDTSVMQADFDEMVTNDWTYLVEGTITKSDGQSCPPSALAQPGDATPNGNMSGTDACYDTTSVSFRVGASAETAFGPCETETGPGFAIAADSTQTVAATIHGDHLFFNGFPEGDEGGVRRLAQWMADCDLNLDGMVTQAELEAIDIDDLPAITPEDYNLGGAPIENLSQLTMYDYVIAQFKTQGHYQGEGECAIDGVEHDHGDEE